MRARTILIIDGDRKNRKSLDSLFKNTHYDVESTSSAAYAIAKIVQGNDPVVLLGDTFEEDISSQDVVALMRHCNKKLKIILVSDDTSLELLKKMRADGIFYHAFKPQDTEDNNEILSAVQYAITY